MPCRAVPCRAVPCRAVPCRAGIASNSGPACALCLTAAKTVWQMVRGSGRRRGRADEHVYIPRRIYEERRIVNLEAISVLVGFAALALC